jgi:large subunit ribosomal protein L25
MTMEVRLRAEKRQEHGKGAARKLRAGGRIPAVLYGKDSDALSLSIEAHEADLLFQAISVENTIVDLEIAGEKKPVRTLIREIQAHPYRPVLFHVDFLRIREGEMLELDIPVHLIGTAEGVRNAGGVLQQSIHEVPVRCVPAKIPDSLDVDVSHLDVGSSMHVSDLNVGEGVEILLDPDQVICSVVAPRVVEVEEEEVAAEAEEAAEAAEETEDSEEE